MLQNGRHADRGIFDHACVWLKAGRRRELRMEEKEIKHRKHGFESIQSIRGGENGEGDGIGKWEKRKGDVAAIEVGQKGKGH